MDPELSLLFGNKHVVQWMVAELAQLNGLEQDGPDVDGILIRNGLVIHNLDVVFS